MKEENHSVQTFDDIDKAMKEYFYITQKNYIHCQQSQG